MNFLSSIKNKASYLSQLYINSFRRNMLNTHVKEIDIKHNKVVLYARGNTNYLYLDIFEVFYDFQLISAIKSEISVKIGYYCGLNYSQLIHNNNNNKLFNYSIHDYNSCICSIISCDRKKNISFLISYKKMKKESYMSPRQIIGKKGLIEKFHPIQACYIGMLAGIHDSSNNIAK